MKTFTAAAAAALLLAGTAVSSAADLAYKSRPVVAPVEMYSWTGFYIGAHVGAGWGTTETTLTGASITPPPAAIAFSLPFAQNSRSGFLGGSQAGYNWQNGWAVFGVQGDISGMDVKGTTPCLVLLSCTQKSDWLASATGRFGAVVLDRGLVYVKGGGAWMNTKSSVDLPTVGVAGIGGNLTNKDVTYWGWTIGMGTEWMITRNWSAFVEYNYYEFDKKNDTFGINPTLLPAGAAVNINADIRNTLSVAKVGLNYKFDYGAPLVARY